LSCKEIVMGKQSNIGPIDPQFGGVSCAGVIEEFREAIKWSDSMVEKWLSSNMLSKEKSPKEKAKAIVKKLGSHKETYTHSKHIHIDECRELGIKVVSLESFPENEIDGCKDLQDCVLTIHHTYMHTFSKSTALKIVENHIGSAMIVSAT